LEPNLAVVAITAFPSEEIRLQLEQSGWRECLIKPFTKDQLLTAVSNALGHT